MHTLLVQVQDAQSFLRRHESERAWTQKHGFRRLMYSCVVPVGRCHEFEADLWMNLARQYGPHNVRGGEVTIVERHTDTIPDWLLPEEFGGERIVDWGWGFM